VRAVEHHVVAGDDRGGVRGLQIHGIAVDLHLRVQQTQLARDRVRLALADVGRVVERLADEVPERHRSTVHHPDIPHSPGSKLGGGGRAGRAGSDHDYARLLEADLSLETQPALDLARVAFPFRM